MNTRFSEPEACWHFGVPQQRGQRSHQACRASRKTFSGSSPVIVFYMSLYHVSFYQACNASQRICAGSSPVILHHLD